MSGADVAGTEKVNATEPASNAAKLIFDRIFNLLTGGFAKRYLFKAS
ncbi:hypothetical protein [Nitrobacter sp. 62-13]|nr:hypothetical protein [Nitrobacter sp. 62-13]